MKIIRAIHMENKPASRKKLLALATSAAFIFSAIGISVAIAAITFSGTGITGDSSFTGISGVVSSTIDVGAGTLSLQTASNSPITAGTGLFTIGGALTVNGAFTAGGPKIALSNLATSTAGNIIVANASNIPAYVALAGDISAISATGSVAFASSNGNLTTLSAISSIDRSGTITIGNTNSTGITIGRSGQTVSFPGNISSTGLLNTGNATTTNLSITAFSSGCLSASAGGVIATSTCGGAGTVTTSTAISANNFPFWSTAAGGLAGTSTLSISGTTLTQAGNMLFSAGSAVDSSAAGTLLIGNTTSTGITIGRSGQTVTFPGNLSITGPALFSAGAALDSSAAGTLSIGNSTTTSITLGRSGQTVSFPGSASLTNLSINGGATILKHLSATSSLSFGATAAGACDLKSVAVTGAADGDVVALGIPSAMATINNYQIFTAYVSSTDTVAVKRCNLMNTVTALNATATGTVRVDVWQH